MKLKVQNFSSTPNIHIHCVIFNLVVSIPRIRLRMKDTKIVEQHKAKSTEFFFTSAINVIMLLLFYTYICIYISFIIIILSYFHQIIYVQLFTFFFINVENYNQLCNYRGLISLNDRK